MPKKTSTKKILLAVLLILSILMLSLNTYATNPGLKPATITLQSSKNKINPGDTIVLDLKLTNITLSSGIHTITMNLDVDENIFEMVKREDIENDSTWVKSYNATTKQLKLTSSQKIKEDKDLAKISLKAKSSFSAGQDITASPSMNATVGSPNATTINLKNVKVNTSRNLDDVSVKIAVQDTQLPTPVPGLTPTPTPGPVQPQQNPSTGLDNPYVVGIVTLVIIAVLSILGHKKATGKIG